MNNIEDPSATIAIDDEEMAAVERINTARAARKAELTMHIKALQATCQAIADLDDQLNDDNEDWADSSPTWSPWLRGEDLTAFRYELKIARRAARSLAAIHRPHPGTDLWPTLGRPEYRPGRTEYAVKVTWADGAVQMLGDPDTGEAYTWLRYADIKAHRLRQDPACQPAVVEVVERAWTCAGWNAPDRSED